jgi:O-phosphoseryl-tRNA synthetase
MASMLHMNLYPVTNDGRKLMDSIISTAIEHGNTSSPCEFTAFQGEFMGKDLEVKIIEPEAGTKLLGPASWNRVHVYDGNIVGVPQPAEIKRFQSPEDVADEILGNLGKEVMDDLAIQALKKGIPTGISYMAGVAAQATYHMEEMVVSGEEQIKLRSTIAKSPSDINLKLDELAMRYINSRNKVIDIRGPIFCTITGEIK